MGLRMSFESLGLSLQGNVHFLKPLYGLNIRVYRRIHVHLCFYGRDDKSCAYRDREVLGHQQGDWGVIQRGVVAARILSGVLA